VLRFTSSKILLPFLLVSTLILAACSSDQDSETSESDVSEASNEPGPSGPLRPSEGNGAQEAPSTPDPVEEVPDGLLSQEETDDLVARAESIKPEGFPDSDMPSQMTYPPFYRQNTPVGDFPVPYGYNPPSDPVVINSWVSSNEFSPPIEVSLQHDPGVSGLSVADETFNETNDIRTTYSYTAVSDDVYGVFMSYRQQLLDGPWQPLPEHPFPDVIASSDDGTILTVHGLFGRSDQSGHTIQLEVRLVSSGSEVTFTYSFDEAL